MTEGLYVADVVETLIVKVEGDLSDLRRDLKKSGDVVEKGSKKMSASTKKASSAFDGLGKRALKLAAGIGVVGLAFKSLRDIFRQFGAIDVLAKTADRLGLTTEALVGLQFAAGQTGVESNILATSLQRLNRRLAEVATTGGGTAKKSLDALNLTAEELLRLPLEEQFGVIADRLGEVSSQADKTQIAFGFFDTEGGKLLNTLRLGSKGLADFSQEARDLGIAVSRVDAAKIEAANDTLDKLTQTFVGSARRAAVGLAPAIDFVADAFVEMNKQGDKSTPIIDRISQGIVVGFTIGRQVIARFQVVQNAAIFGFGKLGEFATKAADFAIRAFARLRAGVAGVGIVTVTIANAFVMAFQDVSRIATNTWKIVRAGADVAAASINLVFEKASETVRGLVQDIEDAIQATGLVAAARAGPEGFEVGQITALTDEEKQQRAIEGQAAVALSAVDAASQVLDASVLALKDASSNLLAGPAAPGSETLTQLSKDFEAIAIAQLKVSEGSDGLTAKLAANLERIREFTEAGRAGLDVSLEEFEGTETVDQALARFEELKKVREVAFQAQIDQRLNRDQILADIDARALANRLEREKEANEKSMALAEKAAEAQRRLDEQTASTRLGAGRQFLSDLATLQSSESRKAFEVGKAAAIAEAGVNTFLAATKAYQALAGIPVVGPGLGAAAAAAAIAAGVVNIQKIRSMQFGGGGAAGGGGGTAPASSAATGAGGAGGAGGGGQGGGPVQSQQFNISLQGERFSQGQIRELLEDINEQLGDNATLQVG